MSSSIIPSLRYRDAAKAIEWLCHAFGFERHLVVDGPDDHIAHAQLSFGAGMIMLGSAREADDWNDGGTSSLYVVVGDDAAVDAHCARARAAGATITVEPEDQDHGGRLYGCRDLEGSIWSFGSYDPWDRADLA